MASPEIVHIRTRDGRVHRAARIDGIPGLMTYEADNLDETAYDVLANLSEIDDISSFCRRCFGKVDADLAQDVPPPTTPIGDEEDGTLVPAAD